MSHALISRQLPGLNLSGLRSGSLNEALRPDQRKTPPPLSL